MIRLTNTLAILVVCAFATRVVAAEPPAVDQQFLIQASNCSHLSLKTSELAQKQASDPAVKEFANKLVKEHKECNEELAKSAKDRKIAIVLGADKDSRDQLSRLDKLSGAEFDREYLKAMIEGHEKGIRMLEEQIKSGKDDKLNSFATLMLPRMKDHLKEARDLAAKIK